MIKSLKNPEGTCAALSKIILKIIFASLIKKIEK